MPKETIIIVGGGIAGLIAANELAHHYHIILIEANNRLGGRIYSCKEKNFSTVIEAGSEFIHGKLKETLHLLKQAGIEYVPVKGKMYRKEKGGWKEQEDIIEGWDELLKGMKKVKEDMTMYDFLQQYFGAPEKADLRRHAIAFTEGFDVADIKKVSVRSLYDEWSHESDEPYRIPLGYGALINYLEAECEKKGCRIITGEPVKQIDWETNTVTVYTASEKKFDANNAIITVPISILQKTLAKASINFTPPLDDYVNAAGQIGYGDVIKVLLQFKEAIWKKDTGFILSDEIFPTWWTQLPNPVPLLTGWMGGNKAQRMGDETDEELLEKAILSVSNIFNLTVNDIRKKLLAGKVFNWKKNEWSLGAYSYPMPGSVQAREVLNASVNNTIYFTGEGLYDGESPGTVEAAIVHAKETAAKLLKKNKIDNPG
jgi:monoamine oxidase